jgi:hypothetical protein
MVIETYDSLHRLNEQVSFRKEPDKAKTSAGRTSLRSRELAEAKTEFIAKATELYSELRKQNRRFEVLFPSDPYDPSSRRVAHHFLWWWW